MPRSSRLNVGLVSYLAAFAGTADAFWRMPCRGRSALARMDPLMDPGEPSYHVHSVHGSGAFALDSDGDSLKTGDCTSCAVTQDKSAYWTPALYFMHDNGTASLVPEVGGMLAYYLLYGENVQAFPEGFRMLAGDPFQRNFTWPVPDPPKSEWKGDQASQASLKQKALGFNCLNYEKTAEPSLGRHFLPNKTYLDEHCTDGVRFEMMFPSCWNGKDVDSDDHASHVAYPSLVMDGTCPEGFEKRLVSLFFETIWNTYAFKDYDGYFVLANSDPTGYGYHGDFMHGWDQDVLEQAVKQCTNPSGLVEDCPLFNIQSESDQQECKADLPSQLEDEELEVVPSGLPNGLGIQWGPEYAFPISYSTSSSDTPAISASVGLHLGGIFGGIFGDKSSSTPASSSAEPTSSAQPASSASSATPAVSSAASSSMPTSSASAANNAALDAASSSSSSSSSSTVAPARFAEAPSSSSSTPTPTPTPTETTPSVIATPSTAYYSGPVAEEVVYVEEEAAVLVDNQGKPYSTQVRDTTVSTGTTTSTEVYSSDVSMVTETPAANNRKRSHHHGHKHRRGNF